MTKFFKINLAIVVLAEAIHYFWSVNDQFLPYVLLAVAFSMLLTMYEAFFKKIVKVGMAFSSLQVF